jgi:hypothetical protein
MNDYILKELGNALLLLAIFVPMWWKSRVTVSDRKLPMAWYKSND